MAVTAGALWTARPQAQPRPPIAIVGARIVDGSGNEPFTGTIVVSGGRISAVGRQVEPPADAQTIDGTGKAVLPGFIDTGLQTGVDRSSAAGRRWLGRVLASGVTTAAVEGDAPSPSGDPVQPRLIGMPAADAEAGGTVPSGGRALRSGTIAVALGDAAPAAVAAVKAARARLALVGAGRRGRIDRSGPPRRAVEPDAARRRDRDDRGRRVGARPAVGSRAARPGDARGSRDRRRRSVGVARRARPRRARVPRRRRRGSRGADASAAGAGRPDGGRGAAGRDGAGRVEGSRSRRPAADARAARRGRRPRPRPRHRLRRRPRRSRRRRQPAPPRRRRMPTPEAAPAAPAAQPGGAPPSPVPGSATRCSTTSSAATR